MIDLSDSNISGKKDTWKNGLSLLSPTSLLLEKRGQVNFPLLVAKKGEERSKRLLEGLITINFLAINAHE